jgi:transposase
MTERGEIGMLTQIESNERWQTIRDFLAEHERSEKVRISTLIREAEEERARLLEAQRQAEMEQEQQQRSHELRLQEMEVQKIRAGVSALGLVILIAVGLYFAIKWYGPSAESVEATVTTMVNENIAMVVRGRINVLNLRCTEVNLIKESRRKYTGYCIISDGSDFLRVNINVKRDGDKILVEPY